MIRFLLNTFPTWAVMLGMMLACAMTGLLIYFVANRYLYKFAAVKEPQFAR